MLVLACFGRAHWFLIPVALGTPIFMCWSGGARGDTGPPDVLSVLDVLLRGWILAAQATAVGGVLLLLLVGPRARGTARRWLLIAAAAVALALGQALALANELFVLLHDAAWPLRAALDTLYVQVSVVRIAAGLALAACALGLRRAGGPSRLLAGGGGAGRRAGRGGSLDEPRGGAARLAACCCCCSTAPTSSAPRCGSAGSCT